MQERGRRCWLGGGSGSGPGGRRTGREGILKVESAGAAMDGMLETRKRKGGRVVPRFGA